MASTTLYALPAPDPGEDADGPVQILALGQAVEDLLSTGTVNLSAGTLQAATPVASSNPVTLGYLQARRGDADWCALRRTGGGLSIPNAGVSTQVTYSSATGNSTSWGNISTGYITVPATGWYDITFVTELAPSTGLLQIYIKINDGPPVITQECVRGTSFVENFVASLSQGRALVTGDKVSVVVLSQLAATVNLFGTLTVSRVKLV